MKKEEIITMFSDVNDRMIRYRGDPTCDKMLVDYTIYGDLKWYETLPEIYEMAEEDVITKEMNDLPIH